MHRQSVWLYVFAIAMALVLSMDTPPARSQEPAEPAPAASAGGTVLAARVDALIAAADALAGARIGVYIAPLGEAPIATRGADDGFNTASNTKLVTATAALATLGPAHKFSTGLWGSSVSRDGTAVGRLYLVGGADPSLGIADVQELARSLRVTGVTSVERIFVDDSYFDDEDLPRHYDEQPREQAAFRAPINAAGLAFNSVAIHIVASPSGSGAARVILDPPSSYLKVVESSVSTVTRGRARVRVDTTARRGHLEIRLRGQIRRSTSQRVRRRIPDPISYAGSLLASALREEGVTVSSRTFAGAKMPTTARLLVSRESAALAVLVRGLGKYSNNYMAEMILKTIGAETDPTDAPATWSVALDAVRAFLVDEVGLERDSFVYENGSGLFESNRFTPRQIAKVLTYAALDPRIGPELISSLAISGRDGTLRSRMEESAATGRIRAKTGTLANASALSGYAAVDARDLVVFSILVNDVPDGQVDAARDLQDEIAGEITRFAEERSSRRRAGQPSPGPAPF